MKTYYFILYFLVVTIGFAQQDSTHYQGEVLTGEVIVEKDKHIVLPTVEKIYLTQGNDFHTYDSIDVRISVPDPSFDWPVDYPDIPHNRASLPYPVADFQSHIKAGYGNYGSPLIDAEFFRSLGRVDTRAHLFHESFRRGPIHDENSGNAQTAAALSGLYTLKNYLLKPTISFTHQNYNFYGNTNSPNDDYALIVDEANLDQMNVDVLIEGKQKNITYKFKPTWGIVAQRLRQGTKLNKESNFGGEGSFRYRMHETLLSGFELDGQIASYHGGFTYQRSLLNVHPWLRYEKDNLSITGGFKLSSGTIDRVSNTSLYPQIEAVYTLSEQWTAFGLLTGGQTWNSLQQLLATNEFLDDSLSINQTEYTATIKGGIKGTLTEHMSLEVNLDYSRIRGLPFYTPSPADSARYTLSYDNGVSQIVSLSSSISFVPNSTSMYGAKLEINSYTVETLAYPWHKPIFTMEGYASHAIHQKLIVSAHIKSMGGIKAPANVSFGYVRLATFADVGFSAKYLVNQRASAFIEINNLLNNEYERYLGYPIRGLAFKIGAQYRF